MGDRHPRLGADPPLEGERIRPVELHLWVRKKVVDSRLAAGRMLFVANAAGLALTFGFAGALVSSGESPRPTFWSAVFFFAGICVLAIPAIRATLIRPTLRKHLDSQLDEDTTAFLDPEFRKLRSSAFNAAALAVLRGKSPDSGKEERSPPNEEGATANPKPRELVYRPVPLIPSGIPVWIACVCFVLGALWGFISLYV